LASDYSSYEIIVVDNGSSDDSAKYVTSEFPDVKLIENGCNLGYAGGMNVGIVQSESDVVILLNNDIIVRQNWLSELMDALAADGRIGIAGCKIFFDDGRTLQHAGGVVSFPRALTDHYGYRQPDTGVYDQPTDVDYVSSAAMAIRKTMLAGIGNLDDGFFPIYYDDVDICYRARAAGWRVVYIPTAVLTHLESATMVRDSYKYLLCLHRCRLRFALKHLGADLFLQEFIPAETDWLAQAKSRQERRALNRAYKAALLMTPAILSARDGCDTSTFSAVHKVTGALVDLHAKVWQHSSDK
jgi:GT2 family glycosyltransferase